MESSPKRPKRNALLVEYQKDDEWYELRWDDGYRGRYPFVWLRDNCRCPSCYYPSSRQRSVALYDIDVDIVPDHGEVVDQGQSFQITWPDGHTSTFPSEWLHQNRFDQTDFDPVKKLVPKSWGSEMIKSVPKFEYHMLMEDPRTLRAWLRSLVVSGIALITGAPTAVGVIGNIGKRVGHLRTTTFGQTFQVEAIASASNLAYTTKTLGLHVDLPLYEQPPSIQMLHCIKQCATHGGENQFCDAMKVANDLKQTHPDAYRLLTTVDVDTRLHGADFVPFHFQFARPVITLNKDGSFKFLNHNNTARAPYLNLPPEHVKAFYKSLAFFERKLYAKENIIEFKLKEGEVVTFNNNRVMHGRSSFTLAKLEEEGKKTRHLEGGYLDWDIVFSAFRLVDEEIEDTRIL